MFFLFRIQAWLFSENVSFIMRLQQAKYGLGIRNREIHTLHILYLFFANIMVMCLDINFDTLEKKQAIFRGRSKTKTRCVLWAEIIGHSWRVHYVRIWRRLYTMLSLADSSLVPGLINLGARERVFVRRLRDLLYSILPKSDITGVRADRSLPESNSCKFHSGKLISS